MHNLDLATTMHALSIYIDVCGNHICIREEMWLSWCFAIVLYTFICLLWLASWNFYVGEDGGKSYYDDLVVFLSSRRGVVVFFPSLFWCNWVSSGLSMVVWVGTLRRRIVV
jgi:hypothetical protein